MILKHKATRVGDKIVIQLVDLGKSLKSMEFNCSMEQYDEGINVYHEGGFIQDAFSFLTRYEREFLMSGLTPEEWDRMMSEEEV